VVLVDAGYLLASGGELVVGQADRRRLLVDSGALIGALLERAAERFEGELLRLYWYDGARDRVPTPEQRSIAQLAHVKVRVGNVNRSGQQKGVDALLRSDLEALASHGAVSDAVLLAGDEDMLSAVEVAQAYGVRVHVWGVEPTYGSNQSERLLWESDTSEVLDAEFLRPFFSQRLQAVPQLSRPAVSPAPDEQAGGDSSVTPLPLDTADGVGPAADLTARVGGPRGVAETLGAADAAAGVAGAAGPLSAEPVDPGELLSAEPDATGPLSAEPGGEPGVPSVQPPAAAAGGADRAVSEREFPSGTARAEGTVGTAGAGMPGAPSGRASDSAAGGPVAGVVDTGGASDPGEAVQPANGRGPVRAVPSPADLARLHPPTWRPIATRHGLGPNGPEQDRMLEIGEHIAGRWLVTRGRDHLVDLLPGPFLPVVIDHELLVEAEQELGASLRPYEEARRWLRDGFWNRIYREFGIMV